MATIDGSVPSLRAARVLGFGLTCGPGALPHLDLHAAAAFGTDASAIPTLASLPRFDPSESVLQQALTGVQGVLPGPYGTFSIDVNALDPDAPVETDVGGQAFGGFTATLDRLTELGGSENVKWQLAGPIAIAEALCRAGADTDLALAVGQSAAQRRLLALAVHVADRLPNAHQLIVVDEADVDAWAVRRGRSQGDCLDIVSSVLAVGEGSGTVAVTGPRGASATSMIETGPHIVGLRYAGIAQWAGRIARFVDTGGGLLWEIGRASGPMTEPHRRSTSRLADAVGTLAAAGADLDRVAERSIITTDAGLAGHDVTAAWHVMAALDRLSTYFSSGSALVGLAAHSV